MVLNSSITEMGWGRLGAQVSLNPFRGRGKRSLSGLGQRLATGHGWRLARTAAAFFSPCLPNFILETKSVYTHRYSPDAQRVNRTKAWEVRWPAVNSWKVLSLEGSQPTQEARGCLKLLSREILGKQGQQASDQTVGKILPQKCGEGHPISPCLCFSVHHMELILLEPCLARKVPR